MMSRLIQQVQLDFYARLGVLWKSYCFGYENENENFLRIVLRSKGKLRLEVVWDESFYLLYLNNILYSYTQSNTMI